VEGIEFNFLGLSFGVDLDPLAIKLPMIGRKSMNVWTTHVTEK
jgi:hypothetical protein